MDINNAMSWTAGTNCQAENNFPKLHCCFFAKTICSQRCSIF